MVQVKRRTISKPISFEGVGLHGGAPVKMTLHPASHGRRFIFNGVTTEALAENVTDTSRCTTLGNVQTIEHIMSALAGLGVTDADIELTASEVPGMDGSASIFTEEILNAGYELLGESEVFLPFKRVFFQEGDIKIAIGKGAGQLQYEYNIPNRWPYRQTFETLNIAEDYRHQIAPARTFALSEELEYIQKAGLGKGLDEKSALILGKEGYENECRFIDEPARHKMLDLIGDLALAGIPIEYLNIQAERSGHRTNLAAAEKLRQFVLANDFPLATP